jgi:hypothetical protein
MFTALCYGSKSFVNAALAESKDDWLLNKEYGVGDSLCNVLRSNPKTKDIGLVYFYTMDIVVPNFRGPLPCFADIYMHLPFIPKELEQKLRDLVG